MSEEEESWDDEALLREIEMQLNEIETDEEEEMERDVTEERRRPPPDQSSEEISESFVRCERMFCSRRDSVK